jgi:cell division protein FtsN
MNKRRYTNRNRSLGQGFLIFVIVAVLAVGAGFGLTEYVIKPFFLGEETETPEEGLPQEGFSGSSIIVDQQDVKDVTPEEEETSGPVTESPSPPQQQTATDSASVAKLLYCVQYGSFSDLAGAEAMAASLTASDIDVMVMQKDGAYKVIGTPYITKEEAKASLEKAKTVAGDDLFVTAVEVRMQ